jgi:cell division protein FtsW
MSSFSFTSPVFDKHKGNASTETATSAFLALLITALALSLFGLTMLYSTSYGKGSTLFIKQLTWTGIGISSALFVYIVGYRRILSYASFIILVSAILLVIPRFFPPIKGAYRWIRLLGGVSIQPSEFAKLAVIIFLANYCAIKQASINNWKTISVAFSVLGFIVALVLLGKDLGTSILICIIAWFIFFVAGMRLIVLAGLPALLIPPGLLYLKLFDAERWSRITSFDNPESHALESGYQLFNSLMALGSGYWTGLGFTESKMKAYYLPEAHTDFILSVVGEELGFISIVLVLLAYLAIFTCAIQIAIRSKLKQGLLLSLGLGSILAVQAAINIGVISGFLPTKGIPAPFISYGGSNILMAWTAIGLILSVCESQEILHIQDQTSIKIRNYDEIIE